MRQGTILDATIIAAPPSTENKQKSRDPETHQTKKGDQWHRGMPFDKLRSATLGRIVAAGLVHMVVGTAANGADVTQTAALLHGEEKAVFGDAGDGRADQRPELTDRDVSWNIGQAQHHQGAAASPARAGRTGRAGAGAAACRGRASRPYPQEPLPS
jgi:transposase, IS5 family